VPVRLRRFVLAEWIEESRVPAGSNRDELERDWVARAAAAHGAHTAACLEWMAVNGYDPHAKYGSGTPGWWDFRQRCEDEERHCGSLSIRFEV
jgi:hypothetical protein